MLTITAHPHCMTTMSSMDIQIKRAAQAHKRAKIATQYLDNSQSSQQVRTELLEIEKALAGLASLSDQLKQELEG